MSEIKVFKQVLILYENGSTEEKICKEVKIGVDKNDNPIELLMVGGSMFSRPINSSLLGFNIGDLIGGEVRNNREYRRYLGSGRVNWVTNVLCEHCGREFFLNWNEEMRSKCSSCLGLEGDLQNIGLSLPPVEELEAQYLRGVNLFNAVLIRVIEKRVCPYDPLKWEFCELITDVLRNDPKNELAQKLICLRCWKNHLDKVEPGAFNGWDFLFKMLEGSGKDGEGFEGTKGGSGSGGAGE